nr:AsmA-like C-terminal region-containing protein [Aurantimonas sp. VKM B-3413]
MERPLDVSFADAVNLDIRLSAGQASLGRIPLSDVAAVVTLGDGIAKIDVGDAAVFGGRGQAVLNLDGRGMHPLVYGTAALTDVDTAQMFQTLSADSLIVSGKSNITATLEAPAKDWASIIRDIDCDARIKVRDGAVAGFDPQVFAKPGARRLMDGSIGAKVPFDRLNAEVSMRGSRLRLREVTIANDSGVLNAWGDYYAQTNAVAIRGTYDANPPQTASTTSEFTAAKPVRFTMHGQWPDPDVETEPSDETK